MALSTQWNSVFLIAKAIHSLILIHWPFFLIDCWISFLSLVTICLDFRLMAGWSDVSPSVPNSWTFGSMQWQMNLYAFK